MVVAAVCLAASAIVAAPDEPNLTKEEMKQFLLTANVVSSHHTSKGITSPWRLTLNDGKVTHDASFQTIDEHKTNVPVPGGVEMLFVDSYKYNIAGYILADLLGLGDLVPVTVERKWQGRTGSLSWWEPAKMDEADRRARKIIPPDADNWNKNMFTIALLYELVYDTDPNQTNILIGDNWQVWRIDFTRAFRLHKDLQNPKQLMRCDRQLLERLKKLDADELEQKTKPYLTKSEVKALIARRDKIVAHFEKLIAAKGEAEVLY
jgi:hypothetical protein